VICGFGRTGNMFGSQTYDIKPDMMTLSKQLTSSYLPGSALLINDKVFEPIADESNKVGVLGHGYTVRGVGLIGAIELVTDKSTKTALEKPGQLGAIANLQSLANGFITRNMVDAIAFCPPLVINQSQLDDLIERVGKALDGTLAQLDTHTVS